MNSKYRIFLSLILIETIFATSPAGADAGILEELRRGQHFDRAALYQAGPKVLADALDGKVSDISLLGLYFRNGERGFPKDAAVANRLAALAYQRGHWLSAMNLGREAAERGDHRQALKYYLIVFLVADEIDYASSLRGEPIYQRAPTMTHLAYAEIRILTKSKEMSDEELSAIGAAARREAVERGFFHDCAEAAKKFCGPAKKDEIDPPNFECRMAAEKLCFQRIR